MAWDKKPATPAVRLQREVITILNSIGFEAWINKTGGIFDPKTKRFRKNVTGRNGVSDVLGLQKGTGRFLAVELKASKGDKLSDDQALFINDVVNGGGLAVCVHNMDDLYNFLYRECPNNYGRLDQFTKRKFETKHFPPRPNQSSKENIYPERVREYIKKSESVKPNKNNLTNP